MPWQMLRRDENHLWQQGLYGGVVADDRRMCKEASYGTAACFLLRQALELERENREQRDKVNKGLLEAERRRSAVTKLVSDGI